MGDNSAFRHILSLKCQEPSWGLWFSHLTNEETGSDGINNSLTILLRFIIHLFLFYHAVLLTKEVLCKWQASYCDDWYHQVAMFNRRKQLGKTRNLGSTVLLRLLLLCSFVSLWLWLPRSAWAVCVVEGYHTLPLSGRNTPTSLPVSSNISLSERMKWLGLARQGSPLNILSVSQQLNKVALF